MKPRAFVIGLLLGAMLSLTPLAQASPPDQTWIAGLYDNADYDDVVCAVTAAIASLDLRPAPPLGFGDTFVALAAHIDERAHATLTPASNHTRAPPAP
jgi:hypothetical protein